MKYCYQCGKMASGDPLFCDSCGRSYDLKLCPRLHMNSRGAEVCAKCGSRDLSTPQPKIPMNWRLLALLARLGLGLVLFYASLSLIVALMRSAAFRELLIYAGMLLAALWWAWSKLPDWFQELLRALWRRKEHNDDEQ